MILNKRQQTTLDFIKDYIAENDYPPTYREIAEGVGVNSTAVVDYRLKELEALGRLILPKNRRRAIRVVKDA